RRRRAGGRGVAGGRLLRRDRGGRGGGGDRVRRMSPSAQAAGIAAGPAQLPVPRACLLVLDGWGLAQPSPGNAVALARTPVFDELWQHYPHTTLSACGPAVGLPEGQMGNSEVGHLNLGAGAVVRQDLVRIDEAIAAGRDTH